MELRCTRMPSPKRTFLDPCAWSARGCFDAMRVPDMPPDRGNQPRVSTNPVSSPRRLTAINAPDEILGEAYAMTTGQATMSRPIHAYCLEPRP
jgi:hypothetical protein